jgi:hypothetical protein
MLVTHNVEPNYVCSDAAWCQSSQELRENYDIRSIQLRRSCNRVLMATAAARSLITHRRGRACLFAVEACLTRFEAGAVFAALLPGQAVTYRKKLPKHIEVEWMAVRSNM